MSTEKTYAFSITSLRNDSFKKKCYSNDAGSAAGAHTMSPQGFATLAPYISRAR
jgi:hypothetical protein